MKKYELRSDKFEILELQAHPKNCGQIKNIPGDSFEFVGAVADYLIDAYEEDGIEAEVYLDILQEEEKETKRLLFTKYCRYDEKVSRVTLGLK